MYRRSFPDEKIRRKLQRLDRRLRRSPITWITSLRPKNEERLAGQLTLHGPDTRGVSCR
jgi:hypothetical protein